MIVDKKEFDKFIDIIPDLQDDEVYFVSLSARNKYLTDEERIEFSLGRTEMFGRTIVKSKDDFYYVMDKLKAMLLYKYTKNHKKIPEKCSIIYINVNPSSMIKAYEMFTHEMDGELFQILQASRTDKNVNYLGFNNMQRKMMNCVQKCRSNRYFLDIDIDSVDAGILKKFREGLKDITYHVIQTQGGWHVLIEKETLKKEIKLHKIVEDLHAEAIMSGGEVKFNSNQMVPIPGTLQASKLVRII